MRRCNLKYRLPWVGTIRYYGPRDGVGLHEIGCHFPEQLKSIYNEQSIRLQTGRDPLHELRRYSQRKQSHKVHLLQITSIDVYFICFSGRDLCVTCVSERRPDFIYLIMIHNVQSNAG